MCCVQWLEELVLTELWCRQQSQALLLVVVVVVVVVGSQVPADQRPPRRPQEGAQWSSAPCVWMCFNRLPPGYKPLFQLLFEGRTQEIEHIFVISLWFLETVCFIILAPCAHVATVTWLYHVNTVYLFFYVWIHILSWQFGAGPCYILGVNLNWMPVFNVWVKNATLESQK